MEPLGCLRQKIPVCLIGISESMQGNHDHTGFVSVASVNVSEVWLTVTAILEASRPFFFFAGHAVRLDSTHSPAFFTIIFIHMPLIEMNAAESLSFRRFLLPNAMGPVCPILRIPLSLLSI
jgi:hypothetical protein